MAPAQSTSTVTTTTGSSPATTTSSEPPEPEFAWSVVAIDESNMADAASTWRPDCPVGLAELRLVSLSHWDFDGRVAEGRLVIHRDHLDDVVEVFGVLFAAEFPIERMRPVDAYGGDDQVSMADNNTSGFNCREIEGAPGVWSQHAYGGAIDINPLLNPWVQGSRVDPAAGEAYADRTVEARGMIRDGDVVTQAFASVGWGWGGDWSGSKDYQHFSWNGR